MEIYVHMAYMQHRIAKRAKALLTLTNFFLLIRTKTKFYAVLFMQSKLQLLLRKITWLSMTHKNFLKCFYLTYSKIFVFDLVKKYLSSYVFYNLINS